jgi:ribonuclease P protein component
LSGLFFHAPGCVVLKKENYKLKKLYKIKSSKVFQRVYSTGHRFLDDYGVFYILPAKDKTIKMGFAVGKKLGNAVVRNHTKRLMREIYRTNRPFLKKKVHIIWVARKRLATADISMYKRVFDRLATKAGLW